MPLAPVFAQAADTASTAVPAPAPASDADIDRLLKAMDMQSMMDDMLKQTTTAQQVMVEEAFGKDASDADRERMHDILEKTNAITLRHMSWTALEPVMRKVYTQVFSKREVEAMIAFYSTPEGASMLKKMPQAMTLSMQEIQPIVRDTMAEVKAMIDAETSAPKSKRPRP
ncbi:hypothetical protein GCM10025793_08030 [Lysobacter lycopersici]